MPETPSDAPAPKRRRRVWPWILGIFGILLAGIAALVLAGAAFAGEALEVRDDLRSARSQLTAVPGLVASGDTAQFQTVAAGVLADTTRADQKVQGPLWEFATWIPWVGQNVAAVRATTEATHILVRDALPPAFAVLSSVRPETIRFEGGGFNLEPFRAVLAELPAIEGAFAEAQEKVASIDRSELHPIVDDAIGEVLDVIDETAPLARTATAVLPTALGMLGENEPRTYLVIFQNNAEIRATGGNPAAAVYVRAEGGRVALVGQSNSTIASDTFGGQQLVALPPETAPLYEVNTNLYSQDYTRTPNFPTTAALFQGLSTASGVPVDGVISLDPVVLSKILGVTGGVNVDGIDINAESAVRVLLSETYQRFPADQAPADAFFAATSAAVFDKLVTGSWDPLAMIEVFRQAIAEQRVYGWFTREAEEQVAVELGIDGALKTDNASTTELGIFLNDFGVGKLEYYLTTAVRVSCDLTARTTTTTITMTSAVPDADLGYYVLSLRNGQWGLPQSSMVLDVLYIAPPGATIVGSDPPRGDIEELSRSGVEAGRSGTSITIGLAAGETRSVSYTSTLPDGAGPISVRHSPTVTSTPVEIDGSCGELVPVP